MLNNINNYSRAQLATSFGSNDRGKVFKGSSEQALEILKDSKDIGKSMLTDRVFMLNDIVPKTQAQKDHVAVYRDLAKNEALQENIGKLVIETAKNLYS